jgi:hypothetical protein
VEEGIVGLRHGFALGESRVRGVGHGRGGLGRGRRIVEARGEDGLGGFMDRESGQCSLLAGNGRARSMMQRSWPSFKLLSWNKAHAQVLPGRSAICSSTIAMSMVGSSASPANSLCT